MENMKEKPVLSIVIVSWNVREDLRECLQSILREKGSRLESGEIEIIVVDNASTDGTAKMDRA
jgi:N-acetylglucosaminyl-diphospho-decaprenol L-rhamnosyltransferase